ENLRKAKAMLDALPGRIPEILSMEIGIDITGGAASGDLVLSSSFATTATLEAYQAHPEHQKVVPFLRAVQSSKFVVDYEIPAP
ncbi:MAG TPA: Dabb family protein, partial [Bacteroidota bacterium]|nr:Dabb family protein [Bacteroidota bacterium]